MYIKNGVTWFEDGDRVELVVDHPDGNDYLVRGCLGTVMEDTGNGETEDNLVSVCWDNDVNGHEAGRPDLCPQGHGWNVERSTLAFLPTFDDRDTEYDLESEQELMSMLGVTQ